MTTSTEPSAHFDERDLRSAKHSWNRDKTSSEKWARGHRPSPGVFVDMVTGVPLTGSEGQHAKMRPRKIPERDGHNTKRTPNFIKGRNVTLGRAKTKLAAAQECDDAPSDLPSSLFHIRHLSESVTIDKVLYSFDNKDSPQRTMTLDVFVKTPTARETERLVAKEYEILDANGEAVKGQRARRILRHEDEAFDDADMGFELV